jgi:ATP-dependent Clp protease ATP-binding subunit ClpA
VSEAVIAGVIAGAVAGVIAAVAIFWTSRRDRAQPGKWQASLTHTPAKPRAHHTGAPPRFVSLSFNDFDDGGKRVMAAAQDEAIRANHNYIGTEHLLAALVRADSDGPAGRALARLGVSLDRVRTALEFIVGRGDRPVSPSEVTLSPRTLKVLDLARDEAQHLGHHKVGAAEMLIALVREGEGIASGILESLGFTLERVRQAVVSEMGTGPRSPAPGTPPPQPGPPPARMNTYRGPFDRFNDRAKRTLALAQDEAMRFNHNYLGPEHLLLGLVREGEGVAARVIAGLGIPLSKLRGEVERIIGRGESTSTPSEITITPRTKKVIDFAIDESDKLGHHDVRTEHLLLGLIRDDTSMACAILKSQGATLETIRQQVIAMLSDANPRPPTAG